MAWHSVPIIGAQDVAHAAHYYRTALGFEGELIAPEADANPVYAVLRRDSAEVHLQIRRHAIWGSNRDDIERSAYFYVPELDSLHAEFLANGADMFVPPTAMAHGMREMVVLDPQGHRLAFGENPGATAWYCAPILGTKNVSELADWFCNRLQFDCPDGVFNPDGAPGVYAILLRNGASIHLQIRHREVFPEIRESIETDAYLFVDDVDATYAEILARSRVRVLREPLNEPYGLRDFTIEDPHGHRLGFAAPI